MIKPKIFISYSHNDEQFKNKLLAHLSALKASNEVEIFDTKSIEAGKDWHAEINKNIKEADIAILIISSDFLASEYIFNVELRSILNRNKEAGQIVIPVLARPAMWTMSPELMKFQIWPRNAKALSEYSFDEIDNKLSELSKEIAGIVGSIKKEKGSEISPEQIGVRYADNARSHHFFVSHDHSDGDFAELMTLRLKEYGYNAWTDIEKLPVGEDWRFEIDNSIKAATAVIVVMSPDARLSEYVTYEWAFALGHGTRVIPILLKQTSLHPRLASLQYLDFTNRVGRPWDKLMETCKGLLPID